jgi:hypothetical protein
MGSEMLHQIFVEVGDIVFYLMKFTPGLLEEDMRLIIQEMEGSGLLMSL